MLALRDYSKNIKIEQMIKFIRNLFNSDKQQCNIPVVSCRYMIEAKKDSLGWKVTLYKKCFGMWCYDTITRIKIGYEYMVDDQINEWVDTFNIPTENVRVPNGS